MINRHGDADKENGNENGILVWGWGDDGVDLVCNDEDEFVFRVSASDESVFELFNFFLIFSSQRKCNSGDVYDKDINRRYNRTEWQY
jgi:hypothetical protein